MRAFNVSSVSERAIYAPFSLTTAKQTTLEKAMLDSGASDNFMDFRTAIRLGIGTKKLHEPRKVTNVDGTQNHAGKITRYANLEILYDGQKQNMDVFVTNLGRDRFLLGLPWFQTFDPKISWKEGQLKGIVSMRTANAVTAKINATQATEWAIKGQATKTELTEKDIPVQYQEYKDVFSETGAKRFPPSREDDHPIVFTEDAPKTFKPITYKMEPDASNFLRKWLDEEERKGYIRLSSSQYTCPTFLIKKKNGDYRVVQDYQTLNKYTVPDNTGPPLITDLIEQLHGKTLFTKFDIRMGYNNIRIKDGDQHKAAFTTPHGHYEPMVMNFGLRNAPGTFLRTMRKAFRRIQNKYPDELLIYIDDILIATNNDIQRHRTIVTDVLQTMREESLFFKISKCEFEQEQMEYLGLLLNGNTIRPDPSKVAGLKEWPRTLKSVHDVRSTLGLLNYHRAFVPGFSHIVKPLTTLLKKNELFLWTPACTNALDRVINILTSEPVLTHPDPKRQFELEVDASNFATGAILFQRDERGKPKPIGFHSKTLSKEEMNYDIYDKELTAMDRGLDVWRHLLINTHTIVHTDHANLTYYRKPQKLTPRAKRAVARIMQYDIAIKHKPGILNKADPLSRRPDYPTSSQDDPLVAFPDSMFLNTVTSDHLIPTILDAQRHNDNAFQTLPDVHYDPPLWKHRNQLVVPENNDLRRGVISLYHDSNTAGHPGIRRTFEGIQKDLWWPEMKEDVKEYVKGCALCQSTKPRTNTPKPPYYPITAEHPAIPFGTIAMDFITKLPESNGNDTIITITDHDCSKAAIFLPCKETITAEGVAKLYATQIFPHYGIPNKIISDRDPRFTGEFFKTLCTSLGIDQNLSTAYHPQTDGQSERTNQWLEQYLRIYGNNLQNDWADWLAMAQYVHNAWINETTKNTPFDLLIGITPRAHQQTEEPQNQDERIKLLLTKRRTAHEAMERAQELMKKKRGSRYIPFQKHQKVWLEGSNLKTTHPTAKLAPKRYGPFPINNKISDVVYQLDLPPQWKIHNVFHASLLTPYQETETHGPNFTEPPPDIIEGEPEYEVEEIIGSRRVGKKRTLEFRVRWKGYSPAHDTWEPAAHIHAPELIKRYQMRSIGKALQSSPEEQAKPQHEDKGTPKSPSHRSARTLRPTEISNLTLFEIGSEKHAGTPTGNNTQDERTRMGSYFPNSTFTDNEKRIKRKGILAQKPSSPSHIASTKMNPLTNDTPDNVIELPADHQVGSYLELRTIEAYMRQESEEQSLVIKTPDYLAERDPNPEPITEEILRIALARHNRVHQMAQENAIRVSRGGEMNFPTEDKDDESINESRPPTPATHPGYPYLERLARDIDDLPISEGPYQAVRVNPANGEPRLLTKEDCDTAAYDEGPVHAQPVEKDDGLNRELDQEGRVYPFDENSMMDIQFLAALGIVADRGIAAENLRLVQSCSEQRALDHWEKRLQAQEEFTLAERRKFYEAKKALAQKRWGAHKRLQKAKAGGRLGEQFQDMPQRPRLPPDAQGRPYPGPLLSPKKEPRQCYWCTENTPLRGIDEGHYARNCPTPHRRCQLMHFGRCLVPHWHKHYQPFDVGEDERQFCPYDGDNLNKGTTTEHA